MDKERLDEQRLEEDVFNINFKIGKKKAIAWMLSIALVVASVPLTVGAASARRSHINSTGVFEYKEAGSTKVRIDSADLLYMADEVDGVDESLSDIEDNVTTLENAVSDITAYGKGNASGSDLLSGKTAWVNGSMITGSMTNNGALSKSFTPSMSSQSYTIPAGYTSGGTVTCAAIPNQRTASSETISSAKTYYAGYYPSNWTVTPRTANLGTRSITPTSSSQTVYASTYGYDGFSSVTVNAGYSGSYGTVNTNGTYTVGGYNTITVNVPTGTTPSGNYAITLGASEKTKTGINVSSYATCSVDATAVYNQGYNDASSEIKTVIINKQKHYSVEGTPYTTVAASGGTYTINLSNQGFDYISGVVLTGFYASAGGTHYFAYGETTGPYYQNGEKITNGAAGKTIISSWSNTSIVVTNNYGNSFKIRRIDVFGGSI